MIQNDLLSRGPETKELLHCLQCKGGHLIDTTLMKRSVISPRDMLILYSLDEINCNVH